MYVVYFCATKNKLDPRCNDRDRRELSLRHYFYFFGSQKKMREPKKVEACRQTKLAKLARMSATTATKSKLKELRVLVKASRLDHRVLLLLLLVVRSTKTKKKLTERRKDRGLG